MTTWSEFRRTVRVLLNDVQATQKYSDELILNSFKFAQSTLCEHTAYASGVTYENPTGLTYTLPDNIYEPVDISGYVYLDDGEGPQYLNPVYNSEKYPINYDYGYYTYNDTLYLNAIPDSGLTLYVRYFAYYPDPVNDSDPIYIPKWAESAVAYLTAGVTIGTQSARFRILDQFKDKNDRGVPQENAFVDQSNWYFKQYEATINKHQRQDRSNFLFRRVT